MLRNAKSGRSTARSIRLGVVHVLPWLLESLTNACSLLRPCRPSDQPNARVFGAPTPVGVPLATSRLGNELVRAPAIPSNEMDLTPSNWPTSVTFATTRGFF